MAGQAVDEEILQLYRAGAREEAFARIVSAYSQRLYWHIRRMVHSHEDADDLLQDIFVKIWVSLPSFRAEAGLFTWIYRIATNETLNFLDKRRRRSALTMASAIDTEVEGRIEDDPYFDGNAAQKELAKAVASLPERQRAVFCMRYFDEIKYEDMSQILGTSVGSLKASYHIAYNKIKELLLESS